VEVTYWLIYSWRTTGVSKTFKDCLWVILKNW
jgi:hypothetical protein